MRILSIGNSFSQDAQRYLHGVARASGKIIDCINLYIGGCSLERHYRNMLSGEKAYSLEFNGQTTGFNVSLEEALLAGHYDVITLQQVSGLSVNYSAYTPYITELAAYVRKFAPNAKLMIHQTWGYEEGSSRLESLIGSTHMLDMQEKLSAAYKKAGEAVSADGIIPSGELLYELYKRGIEKVHRDGFHASYGVSRYALALLWTRVLTGADVTENTFSDFDEPVSDEEKRIVMDALAFVCP